MKRRALYGVFIFALAFLLGATPKAVSAYASITPTSLPTCVSTATPTSMFPTVSFPTIEFNTPTGSETPEPFQTATPPGYDSCGAWKELYYIACATCRDMGGQWNWNSNSCDFPGTSTATPAPTNTPFITATPAPICADAFYTGHTPSGNFHNMTIISDDSSLTGQYIDETARFWGYGQGQGMGQMYSTYYLDSIPFYAKITVSDIVGGLLIQCDNGLEVVNCGETYYRNPQTHSMRVIFNACPTGACNYSFTVRFQASQVESMTCTATTPTPSPTPNVTPTATQSACISSLTVIDTPLIGFTPPQISAGDCYTLLPELNIDTPQLIIDAASGFIDVPENIGAPGIELCTQYWFMNLRFLDFDIFGVIVWIVGIICAISIALEFRK